MPARWRTETVSIQSLMIEACWRPMVGDVAGDFHDVIDLKDGRVAIVIGDVAGVGPEAAEEADELQAELLRLFRRTDSPAGVLSLLDQRLARSNPTLYATLACAVVDPRSRSAAVASAGHPPILFANGLEAHLLDGSTGPPLGLAGERSATSYPLPGDAALFLYTDGLVERRASSLETTLEEMVRAGRGLHGAIASAAELARRTTARLGQPADDATVVSVRMLANDARRIDNGSQVGGRSRIVLRIYVNSRDLRSTRTEAVVKELALQTRDTLDFFMEVIDVSVPGADAELDGILAAPTIVRVQPEPVIRVVGSVRSVEQLAGALHLPLSREDTW
jgi:Stage II sporulation protein E (SpoIIE)/KaiB domain